MNFSFIKAFKLTRPDPNRYVTGRVGLRIYILRVGLKNSQTDLIGLGRKNDSNPANPTHEHPYLVVYNKSHNIPSFPRFLHHCN